VFARGFLAEGAKRRDNGGKRPLGHNFLGHTRFAQVARCAQPQPADSRQFRRVAALTLDKVSAQKKGPGLLKHGAL